MPTNGVQQPTQHIKNVHVCWQAKIGLVLLVSEFGGLLMVRATTWVYMVWGGGESHPGEDVYAADDGDERVEG